MCNFLVEIAISDLPQILATEIQTNFNKSPRQNAPSYAEKRNKQVPKIQGVLAIERPVLLEPAKS
jgi:hypothetical protein